MDWNLAGLPRASRYILLAFPRLSFWRFVILNSSCPVLNDLFQMKNRFDPRDVSGIRRPRLLVKHLLWIVPPIQSSVFYMRSIDPIMHELRKVLIMVYNDYSVRAAAIFHDRSISVFRKLISPIRNAWLIFFTLRNLFVDFFPIFFWRQLSGIIEERVPDKRSFVKSQMRFCDTESIRLMSLWFCIWKTVNCLYNKFVIEAVNALFSVWSIRLLTIRCHNTNIRIYLYGLILRGECDKIYSSFKKMTCYENSDGVPLELFFIWKFLYFRLLHTNTPTVCTAFGLQSACVNWIF